MTKNIKKNDWVTLKNSPMWKKKIVGVRRPILQHVYVYMYNKNNPDEGLLINIYADQLWC